MICGRRKIAVRPVAVARSNVLISIRASRPDSWTSTHHAPSGIGGEWGTFPWVKTP
jgi:hypothetical protein